MLTQYLVYIQVFKYSIEENNNNFIKMMEKDSPHKFLII